MSKSMQGSSSVVADTSPGEMSMEKTRQALFDALAQNGNGGNIEQGVVQQLLEATAGLGSDEQQLADEADKSLAAALTSVIAEMSMLQGDKHDPRAENEQQQQQQENEHSSGPHPESEHDHEDLQLFQQIQNHLSLLPESIDEQEEEEGAAAAAVPNNASEVEQSTKDTDSQEIRIEGPIPNQEASSSSSEVIENRQDLNIDPSLMNLLGEGSDLDSLAMTDLSGCCNASLISVVMLARQGSNQGNESFPGPKTLDELASTLDSSTIDQVGQVLSSLMSSLAVARSEVSSSSPSPSNETRQSPATTTRPSRQQQQQPRQRHRNHHHVSIRKMAVHQQLRIRLENRERKKKWRNTNSVRNKDNDLRSRVIKRATVLFNSEKNGSSPEKQRWIDEEFRRRKQKRIDRERNGSGNGNGNRKSNAARNEDISSDDTGGATRIENTADGMSVILTALTSQSISNQQVDKLLSILEKNSDLLHALLELLAGPESIQLGVSESVANVLIEGISKLQRQQQQQGDDSNSSFKRPPPKKRLASTSTSIISNNEKCSNYTRLIETCGNPNLSLSSLTPYRDDDDDDGDDSSAAAMTSQDLPRPPAFVITSSNNNNKQQQSESTSSLEIPSSSTTDSDPPPWNFGFPPSILDRFSHHNNNNDG